MTALIAVSIAVTAVAAVVVLVVLRLSTDSADVVIFEKVSVVVLPELTPVCTFIVAAVDINEVPFQVVLVPMVSKAVT